MASDPARRAGLERRRAEMLAAFEGGMTITAISKKFEVSWGYANQVCRPDRHRRYGKAEAAA